MSVINRRAFLASTAGAAAGLEAAPLLAQETAKIPPPPQVPLGKTGITLSRVGQGTGMHGGNRQSNHTRMGFEKLVALFRHAFDRGITFFDLADLYGTHIYFREALRFIKRDRVTILTKLWWRYDGPEDQKADPSRRRLAQTTLERFRHELSTDYIDIVLLHCMTEANWDAQLAPYLDALSQAKDKKRVRAVGVSCHDMGALARTAECPWVDVVLARINPQGARMDGKPEEVIPILRKIKQNGKALLGMKIFGEGTLVKQKEECIRFAQGLGLLDAMTIGFEAPHQIDETLTLLAKYPAAKV